MCSNVRLELALMATQKFLAPLHNFLGPNTNNLWLPDAYIFKIIFLLGGMGCE